MLNGASAIQTPEHGQIWATGIVLPLVAAAGTASLIPALWLPQLDPTQTLSNE